MSFDITTGECSEALYGYFGDILAPILALRGYERHDVVFKKWHFTAEDIDHADKLLPLIAEVREYDLRKIDEKVVLCLAQRIYRAANALAFQHHKTLIMTVPDLPDWPDRERAKWAAIVYLVSDHFPSAGAPIQRH